MTLDVVEQILSILPPKAVMRFKCISKKWYALITNPGFVGMHLCNSNFNSMHNNLATTSCVFLKRLVHKNTNTINETNDDEAEEVFSFLHFGNNNNYDHDHDHDHDHDDNDVDDEHEHSFHFSIQDINIPLSTGLKSRPESLTIIGHCNGIICLAHSISGEVILCNPAIQEFKLLPSSPYLPDSDWRQCILSWFIDTLGFGYDPNLNEYKLVNVGFTEPEYSTTPDGLNIYLPPKAAVHTLGTESWREIKTDNLETETTILWPEDFQMHFKEMCFWLGHEQHNEMDMFDANYEEFIRQVIIMFDTRDEQFHDMMLPDCLYDPSQYYFGLRLLVWNQSVALFGVQSILGSDVTPIGIWVMDEHGAWTKHITFERIIPINSQLSVFLKSDEIIMNDEHQRRILLSYNLATKKLKYLPIQSQWTWTDSAAVVYVNSIVSVLGGNKLKSRDHSTPNAGFSLFKYSSSPFSHSMVEKKSHSYSVWAFPSDDISLRIKKVMEGLRAEFGGSEIEPHITIVGSIRMTHEDVLNKFISIRSRIFSSYEAKVSQVVTRRFYYQCVSLLIHFSKEVSPGLAYATGICGSEFQFWSDVRPYLSLLYGYLTEEERKRAQERVSIIDESISSLSFPVTRLALYKIGYKDTTSTLKSWEKIAEYPLQ